MSGYRYDRLGRHSLVSGGFARCKICRVLARASRFDLEGLCASCATAEPFVMPTEVRDDARR
jgi:hypothetical protein